MGAQISNSAEVRQSAILGLGVYRPERVVSNAEICETIDSTDEWIQSRSGIKNRRFANADESVLAMAIASGRKALAASGIEPEQVGAVVVTLAPAKDVHGDAPGGEAEGQARAHAAGRGLVRVEIAVQQEERHQRISDALVWRSCRACARSDRRRSRHPQ